MALTKKFFCPVNGWDCPYFKEDGSCSMVDDGDNPVMECDDAGFIAKEDESPFVWETPDGARYDMEELIELGYEFHDGNPIDPMKMEDDDDFLDWAKEHFMCDEWDRLVDIIRGE